MANPKEGPARRKMNKEEAGAILDVELERFRSMPYQQLVGTIEGDVFTCERVGASGSSYQIEIQTFWDSRSRTSVRILGSADENPHFPLFWKIPLLRWIPIYGSSVTWSLIRKESATDKE